jgi:hypothetical protein
MTSNLHVLEMNKPNGSSLVLDNKSETSAAFLSNKSNNFSMGTKNLFLRSLVMCSLFIASNLFANTQLSVSARTGLADFASTSQKTDVSGYALMAYNTPKSTAGSSVALPPNTIANVTLTLGLRPCGATATGSATVAVSGGVAPYSYSWTRNGVAYAAAPSNAPTNLLAGDYIVTVTDANSSSLASSSLHVENALVLTLVGTATHTPILCHGGTSIVSGTTQGGYAPRTFQLTNTSTNAVFSTVTPTGNIGSTQFSFQISGVPAGTYTVTAFDGTSSCLATSPNITISEPAVLSATATPVSGCAGLSNGSISVSASGGTAPYSYSKNGGASYQASNSFLGLADNTYTIKVKDANGCIFTTSATTLSMPVTNLNSGLSYSTIQAAIDAATAGDVINVCAGTFAENITVSKSLTINGANAGIDPNTGQRTAETILVPSVNDPSAGRLINLQANNVVISGFTLDGDNPSLSGGTTIINGADANTARALNNQPNYTYGLTFENNIVRNFILTGVYLFPTTSITQPNSSFNYIRNNHFVNMHWRGVFTQNEVDAEISNNVFTDVHTGIAINTVSTSPASGFTPRISNNTINLAHTGRTGRHIGISVNHRYLNASDGLIENNTINAGSSIAQLADGIRMTSAVSGGGIKSTNNVINGNNKLSTGYWVWNTDNQSDASITGGSISGVKGKSIVVSNYDTAYAAYSYMNGNYLTVDNVSITTTTNGNGICGHNFSNANPGDIYITLKNNTSTLFILHYL